MSKPAPGRLALVEDFINTADIETATEGLGSGPALVGWLKGSGLLPARRAVECDEQLAETARGLREALRSLCLVNNGARPDPKALRVLAAASGGLRLRFRVVSAGEESPLALEADEGGVRGALGTLLSIVYESMLEGRWQRLKACESATCLFAFYDHSRNHRGRWCSMASCGNRAKVRSYRARHSEPFRPAAPAR